MHIFLTGASGLVGGAVARIAAQGGHQVTGTVGRYRRPIAGLAYQKSVELADTAAIEAAVGAANPEAIINCAALSEPHDCEANPTRAEQLNVALPATLAHLAHQRSIRLVHVSSEQVFDGERAPYHPDDLVAPLNLYGRLKAESERVVQSFAPHNSATVRAPLLLGNSPNGQRSLHERLLADWAKGRTPRLFTDEIRQVAHADNLAHVLLELAQRADLVGIFHWAGTEPLSRHQLGERIRQHFGLSETVAPIQMVSRAALAQVSARRPRDLRLDLQPLRALVRTRPENVAQQLAQLLAPTTPERLAMQ